MAKTVKDFGNWTEEEVVQLVFKALKELSLEGINKVYDELERIEGDL